jgi:hypothetical protein
MNNYPEHHEKKTTTIGDDDNDGDHHHRRRRQRRCISILHVLCLLSFSTIVTTVNHC